MRRYIHKRFRKIFTDGLENMNDFGDGFFAPDENKSKNLLLLP